MPTQELVNYIQQKVNQGYSAESVREFLIQQGYPQNQVDSALNFLSSNNSSKVQSSSALRIVSSGLFLVGVILMIVASMKFFITPELDVKIDSNLLTNEIVQNNPLILEVDLSNTLGTLPETFTISYLVKNKETTKTLFYKHETINLIGERKSKRNIFLPNDIVPGEYELDIEANAQGKSFISRFSFKVKGEKIAQASEVRFEQKLTIEEGKKEVIKKEVTLPPIDLGLDPSQFERMDGA